MYPKSLISFIRSPEVYLRSAQASASDGWWNEMMNSLDISFIEPAAVGKTGKVEFTGACWLNDLLGAPFGSSSNPGNAV